MAVDSDWFKEQMLRLGLSQRGLARKLKNQAGKEMDVASGRVMDFGQ